MTDVERGRETLFVHDEGEGPAVVFIPGLGADHRMYAPQLEALTEFRRIAVDLRGTGRSASLAGIAVDDVLAVQADDVADALRQRGIDRAHLVGISYGGLVVETLMLRHPALLESAVICDSLCDSRPRTQWERVQMAGAALQPTLLRLLPVRWNNALVASYYRKRWPLAAAYLGGLATAERLDDLVLQRRVVNSIALEDALRSCETPTLCLVGDAVPFAVDMMRRVAAALPNSEFAVIPGSFDPSSLCRPEAFSRQVRTWIHRQEDGA